MSKTQPTYAKEFKQEAVRLFETSGKSKTDLDPLLGVGEEKPATLYEEESPGKTATKFYQRA